MKLAYKIWIEETEKVFGEGPYRLLKGVEEFGSLNQAAKNMGMCYSKAWMIIKRAEKQLGFPLLDRKAGGTDGGGSLLTVKAQELVSCYEGFYVEADGVLHALYQKYFGEFFPKEGKF